MTAEHAERLRKAEDTAQAAQRGWAKAATEAERLTAERDRMRQQLEAESVAYYLLRDERDKALAALDRVRLLREHYRASDDVIDGDLRAVELDTALDGSGT